MTILIVFYFCFYQKIVLPLDVCGFSVSLQYRSRFFLINIIKYQGYYVN